MSTTSSRCSGRQQRQHAGDQRRKLAVGEQRAGFAMPQDEGERLGIEPDVERVEHRPAIGTPKWASNAAGMLGARRATVSPAAMPRLRNADASRRQRP